jgi:hypothetical protein
MARLRAAETPEFGPVITLMRGSKPRAIASDVSVEPSSTTMISLPHPLCASALAIVAPRVAAALKQGITTETDTVSPHSIAL